MEEKLLTSPEVAKRLGVTPATINNWAKAGYFPRAYRINPMSSRSAWRIPEGDVDAFVEKRRKERGFMYVPVPVASESDHLLNQEPESTSEPEQLPLPV